MNKFVEATKIYSREVQELYSSNPEAEKKIWADISSVPQASDADYRSYGQDLVIQCIVGLGLRITFQHIDNGTVSYILQTPDPRGSRFIVTARDADAKATGRSYPYYSAERIESFYKVHNGRQGIAVLAFNVSPRDGGVKAIEERYRALHPKLLAASGGVQEEEHELVLEVFAYYKDEVKVSPADTATLIRWVESKDGATMPGFEPVEAKFGPTQPMYSDHWVSNVVSRTGFIQTLADVVGFSPKVQFNAGVVAAGEAQIESTVSGNEGVLKSSDLAEALVDQSQVYLPINNALTRVGHVSLFLDEIGQGVQHLAQRVKDIVGLIARTNEIRKRTGQGFAFLRIPRSYYGRLSATDLTTLPPAAAAALCQALISHGFSTRTGVINMDLTAAQLRQAVETLAPPERALVEQSFDQVFEVVLKSRYINIYKLLRDNLSPETYLSIIRNQILVDLQDNDILYQIFTANILQRGANDEAPFFEFIQRVCSEKCDASGKPLPIRPGCGGFGIRNFLTLFLSIEVSKAMSEFEQAEHSGASKELCELYQQKIDLFEHQLEVSNPVLTAIADAMTAEGDARRDASVAGTPEEKTRLEALAAHHCALKEAGQEELKRISVDHSQQMGVLRERIQALSK